MADYLGRRLRATRMASACASGGVAVRAGYLDVASGASDIVLVGGVEKIAETAGALQRRCRHLRPGHRRRPGVGGG